jgi:hypothetical protein
MSGTLLVDVRTIESDPRFFSMLALVERAAGRRIVVFDSDVNRKGGEKLVSLQYGIVAHRYIQLRHKQWDGTAVDDARDPEAALHRAKTLVAKSLRDRSPVLWVDLDFGQWKGEAVEKLNGIVTLNWAMVMRGVKLPEVGNA